jgi:hypothetical protein
MEAGVQAVTTVEKLRFSTSSAASSTSASSSTMRILALPVSMAPLEVFRIETQMFHFRTDHYSKLLSCMMKARLMPLF